MRRGRWRKLEIRGTLGVAEARAGHGGLDATPADLRVASCDAGPGRVRPGGRTRPGGPASQAGRPVVCRVPVGGGIRPGSARPEAGDEGAGRPAAATAARGAEVLPGPGERPVRRK